MLEAGDKAKETTYTAPSTKQYAFEVTKKTIEVLKGAASLVGVPLAREVLDIGLAFIKTCEVRR